MTQISEGKQELKGEYAEDAIKAFDIDCLLDTNSGAAEYALRRDRAHYWLSWARNLGMEGNTQHEVLINLQHFISITLPINDVLAGKWSWIPIPTIRVVRSLLL